ncbi:MAG: hypothetical protein ABR577_09025 [Pyrinomonadaceae bacterium]
MKDNSRYFELAGAIVCATFLAYVQWLLNRESDEPAEAQIFIRYILLDLSCFLIAFLIVQRLLVTRFKRVLGSLVIALIGAISSTVTIDIPFILNNWGYREIAEGHSSRTIQAIIFLLLLNSSIALAIMLFICGIGFVVGLIQKQLTESQLKID